MNSAKAAQLLEKITQSHLLNNPNSILETENSIQAFGVYTIDKSINCFKIYKNKVYTVEIYSARSALAWCIADKYYIKSLRNNILILDHQLNSKRIDITLFKTLINKNINSSQRWAIEDKLQDALYKARSIKNQLDKCINSAKYYQLKGFENETSRLGLKSPSRKISKGI
jgi:hypothetical protein